MDEVKMAVHVQREAVEQLKEHLVEVGRGAPDSDPQWSARAKQAIRRAVEGQWGTAKIPQFLDEHGVTHWVVDLSDVLGGDVYYALVVRRQGEPVVVGVMSEEHVEGRFRGAREPEPKRELHDALNDLPSQAEMGINPENPNGPTLAEQRDRALRRVKDLEQVVDRLQARLEEKKEERKRAAGAGPALVRWVGSGGPRHEKVTRGAAEEKVRELLQEGVDPEGIEVWSQLRCPKVKIELELATPVTRGGE